MTEQEHTNKAEMILNNTAHLYEREQAIYKVYMLTGDHEGFTRQLIDLAQKVVIHTNLSETADPHMQGRTFDLVQANIYKIMATEYHDEYAAWHEVVDGEVVNK